MAEAQKYAHHFTDLLTSMGYTHCFFVPGGNIMHLLDSARTRLECVPFVHEVSAVIAAEYFNELSPDGRAYALVTAGPGITNAITGIAGAFLESRDVLVVGGQVKSADLARGTIRQRGIQEVDGIAIAAPVCVATMRIEAPPTDAEIVDLVSLGLTDRRGPVFIEFCLDAQATPVEASPPNPGRLRAGASTRMIAAADQAAAAIRLRLQESKRPILLLGGGVSRDTAWGLSERLENAGIPLMTTWNGFDRVPDSHPLFAGRPNTWGQRSANVLLSQADLVIALGTRLGLQQTGFNWQEWTPATVVQVEVDAAELRKGHPRIHEALLADANRVLELLTGQSYPVDPRWIEHCRNVRSELPLLDPSNTHRPGFASPYDLVNQLTGMLHAGDQLIPASSGSGQFVPMETYRCQAGQKVVTNKGLASMGYGLAAAIGASLANPTARTVLIEGDGSFSQNIQELGTAAVRRANVKIFLLDNDGYASIRTTQQNYFGGAYLGCDARTGLGFPSWQLLADAFGIPWAEIGDGGIDEPDVAELLKSDGPALFIVRVDPEQTYFPKITSRVTEDGSMVSNPLWAMTPPLAPEVVQTVFRFGTAKP